MSFPQNRKWLRLILWICMFVLAGILVIEVYFNYLPNSRLIIRKINLESDLMISDNQLVKMLDIEGMGWMDINEDDLNARLEAYPVIRKAKVVKVFPDALDVYVYRRKPLVTILSNLQDGAIPAVFDEEGYAVGVGQMADVQNLPIISGVTFDQPAVGDRFPESLQSILTDLANIRAKHQELFSLISELEVLPQDHNGYDLRLYMNHVRIPVMLGRRITGDNLQRAALVTDVLVSQGQVSIKEVDIRADNVVYRQREES